MQHSLLEDCVFEDNGDHGVSTGARDTDSLNRRLTIRRNGGCGFYFRDDSALNAAHRVVIEDCDISGNCLDPHGDGKAEVWVQGATDGVRLRRCAITRDGQPCVLLGPELTDFQMAENVITPAGEGAVVDRSSPP